ncbi:hypothetical protein [Fictibacillus arsenicus]|uniref:DUF4367 domain-containing protein n=1 Tax=Fictibacillus arsenicus TaxID=255247 RepID=A0A1V3GE13_9BACL|nr:hypothetical protein [Fictibacillus arsenicus]OOE14651.1 hypothetical protein UN64_05545 [Fictibacillus arsenicus]
MPVQFKKLKGEVKTEANTFTLTEVKQAFTDKDMKLTTGEMVSQFKLENVNQAAFNSVSKDQIYIYEFPTADERIRGSKLIEEQTQLIDIAHFPIYLEHKNILVIFMNYLPKTNELENKIRDALKSL